MFVVQNNSNIELKNDVLKYISEKNRDAFVGYVKTFVKEEGWFQVDKIKEFINTHQDTFQKNKNGEILFGVLNFFLDMALMQNYDINVDNVDDLLVEYEHE